MTILNELTLASGEITLLALLCLVLVIDLFVSQEKRIITYWLTMGTLAATAFMVAFNSPESGSLIFSGSYVSDELSVLLKLVSIVSTAVVILYSRDYLIDNDLFKGEFFILILFGLLGIMIMISANSMLVMYLGLETLALSLYALVALDRNSSIAAESAMKYFILGAIASGSLLYGISWVYGVTGSLEFNEIANAIQRNPEINALPLWFGMAFVIVGIAFKFGAVPFHMWLPDVYEGARTPVTLFIASAPKVAAFALIFRILFEGLGGLHAEWQGIILIVSILSIVFGNVVAIAQTNIKRMLAYSAIGHVGFIFAGFSAGTLDGYSSALFYTITYVLMATGSLGFVILLSRKGFESDQIDDFKGLSKRNPWFAMIMMFILLSMAGIPPWVGFFAKLDVISAVIEAGFTGLPVLMVLASVVGAYYYLRIIWFMYFEDGDQKDAITSTREVKIVMSINGLLVLLIGLFPNWLMTFCQKVIALTT
tara:strand:- start:102 stop:1547 length:1446 start_codon:yes stop_codon:yes gene_type:complete